MKTKIPVLVSVLGLALMAGLSLAASSPQPSPAPAAPGPGGPHGQFRARIAEKLDLNADQQKKIDELRAQQHTELKALAANEELAPAARREKARAIMESYRTQIHAVLTPGQQMKAGKMRAHMAQRMHGAAQGRRFGPEARRGPAMQPPHANPLAIVAMGERIKDHMAEKLQLTNEQRDKLEHLGRDFRAQQRDLAKKHQEEMRAVLTPEQQKKVEQWKQHSRRGPGGKAGPQGHRPPFVGMNDEPDGPMMAGLDFGPDDLLAAPETD